MGGACTLSDEGVLGDASKPDPSVKLGRPSNISGIFPVEREALLLLATRRRTDGSRGKAFR
jgi:hypothetical protein